MIAYFSGLSIFWRIPSVLLAYRALLSCPWPEGNDGRYYWQHCAWVQDTDWDNNSEMALACFTAISELYTSQILFYGHRFYDPSDDSIVFQQTFTSPFACDLSPVENLNVITAARWRMVADDGSYSYHLHRRPIGEEDILDGGWDPDGYDRQQLALNNFLDWGFFRSHTGSPLNSGIVAPAPVQWQLRHGTRRRERRGWLT